MHGRGVAAGEGAGHNPRFGIRRFYTDTAAAQNLFPGQSPLIDQSWSAGPMATNALHSIGLLGGSATHFSYAASFFTDVQLVGIVGDDWPAEHTQLLNGRGIDTSGLHVVRGGGWNRSARGISTWFRGAAIVTYTVPGLGLRCVRNPKTN